MLTWEPTMQVHALHAQGWTISAIARHVGVNRRTVRAYLAGREPGRRVSPRPEAFTAYAEYVRLRLTDDPHVWASTVFDEVRDLGYAGSYQSFTRGLRAGRLRPHCEPCAASRGRDHAIIDHPPGEETQWDWVELPDPPPGWGWGSTAYLLVGALSHSSKWRSVLAEHTDQPHLVEALDGVVRRLGGVTRRWRFDRMATVCTPATGRITASFGAIAVYYAVEATTCPARHGNRKGVVEKANHSAAQRWWRTLGDDVTVAQAQASLDRFCGRVGDSRPRRRDGQKTSVAALADAERLRPAPQRPYPVTVEVERVVSAQAMVAYRGSFYSVPPGLAGSRIRVRHRLGEATLEVLTAAGVVLARHHREPDGAGALVRAEGHVSALEKRVLAGFSDRVPCRGKQRRPPSAAALTEADRLRGRPGTGEQVVVDFGAYVAAAEARTSRPAGRAGQR